jgi:hypothetical protein
MQLWADPQSLCESDPEVVEGAEEVRVYRQSLLKKLYSFLVAFVRIHP